MDVLLSILEGFRNPDAHRRELLLHQKFLIFGICGEIRSSIIRYRSKMETSEDYYPRIESVQDSIGNTWTHEGPGTGKALFTNNKLRPGDIINFIVTARDPLGESVEIAVMKPFDILIQIRSLRKYHGESSGIDDSIGFFYEVSPPKNDKS